MSWVVYIFGSGLAFYLGVALLLVAQAVSLGRWRVCRPIATAIALVGAFVVAASGTPLPIGLYLLGAALVLAWLIALQRRADIWAGRRKTLSALAIAVLIGSAAWESQYRQLPTLDTATSRRLYLFGDSLAAGASTSDTNTWPQLLAHDYQLELHNFSRPGATTAMALREAQRAAIADGLVLVEIGGNDILGSTASADYEHALDALLRQLCLPGRQVVMFELPTPPLYNRFGQIQRRLAAQHGVHLIPKRVLMQVIARQGATSDSLHLNAKGHQQMAAAVWSVIGSAYDR